MPKLPKKVRWFVVTQWNVDCDYNKLLANNKDIRYLCYGEEVCPDTGRPHHQMFIYLRGNTPYGNRKLNQMGNWFGKIHCSVKPMFGKIDENEYYCSKESELTKFGNEPAQGARHDLDETKDMILSGEITADQVCVENPGMFHQYGRTLDRLEAIALRKKFRTEMTKGVWYTGPTGVGKSHAVFEGFDPETHYVKNLNEDWWDGYKGQPVVILNEFRGQIRFSELLDLMDKWPKTVKWRCKEPVPFLAKEIRIASIRTPQEVYSTVGGEPWEQFDRRCKIVHLDESAQKCPEGNIETSGHFSGTAG